MSPDKLLASAPSNTPSVVWCDLERHNSSYPQETSRKTWTNPPGMPAGTVLASEERTVLNLPSCSQSWGAAGQRMSDYPCQPGAWNPVVEVTAPQETKKLILQWLTLIMGIVPLRSNLGTRSCPQILPRENCAALGLPAPGDNWPHDPVTWKSLPMFPEEYWPLCSVPPSSCGMAWLSTSFSPPVILSLNRLNKWKQMLILTVGNRQVLTMNLLELWNNSHS